MTGRAQLVAPMGKAGPRVSHFRNAFDTGTSIGCDPSLLSTCWADVILCAKLRWSVLRVCLRACFQAYRRREPRTCLAITRCPAQSDANTQG
jgi:hypothetical protein